MTRFRDQTAWSGAGVSWSPHFMRPFPSNHSHRDHGAQLPPRVWLGHELRARPASQV